MYTNQNYNIHYNENNNISNNQNYKKKRNSQYISIHLNNLDTQCVCSLETSVLCRDLLYGILKLCF